MLAAHATGDTTALVGLYGKAADDCEARGEVDAACFYLVHAYVFALEIGNDAAGEFHRRLVAHGREE